MYNTTAPLQRQIAVFPFDLTSSAGLPTCKASGTLPKEVIRGELTWPVEQRAPALDFRKGRASSVASSIERMKPSTQLLIAAVSVKLTSIFIYLAEQI